MSLISDIEDLLRDIWAYIEKTFVRVVNFFRNIAGWFSQKDRLAKIQADNERVATAIQTNLDNKQYVVVNIFNTRTNKIEEAEAIEYEELDAQTRANFGDKKMVVIT